ncbi:hypothetical protein AN958_10016 [Leucoagaricus sp. SymC.cos]|nr:hypothetical protein AN958_10016 [Leucoagaricus sp. SymC.cos]
MPLATSSNPKQPKPVNRADYRLDVLGLPGPINRWLMANIEKLPCKFSSADELALEDVEVNEVFVQSERVVEKPADDGDSPFTESPTYPYTRAFVSHALLVPLWARSSSWAVLETFKGTADDLRAPNWVSWDNNHYFPQHLNLFIAFSIQVAEWTVNSGKGGVCSSLPRWADRVCKAATSIPNDDRFHPTPASRTLFYVINRLTPLHFFRGFDGESKSEEQEYCVHVD